MLVHRVRRWPSIKPASGERLVLLGEGGGVAKQLYIVSRLWGMVNGGLP